MDEGDIIYDKQVSIDDLLLIYTDKQTNILSTIIDIDYDNLTITLSDTSEFSINDDGSLLLKTDKYEIIDIEKVVEFDVNDIDKVSKDLLTKDVYPEMFIETEESVDKVYTRTEKRENLTSILIQSLNIYDNKYLLEVYSKFADELLTLVENKTDKRDHFKEVLDFEKYQLLPSWIIPVSSNEISLCPDSVNEIFGDYDVGLQKKSTKDLPYESLVNNLYNSNIDNIDSKFIEDGYEIQKYIGDFLRTCIRDNTCSSNVYNYNIDTRRTRHPLYSYNIIEDTYVKKIVQPPKELNICGFILLSENDNVFHTYNNLVLNEMIYKLHNDYSVYSTRIRLNNIMDNLIDIDIDINNPQKYDFDTNKSYYYKTDTTYTKSEFKNILYEYLPTQDTIVKSIDTKVLNRIYNYNHISKLFYRYSIDVNNVLLDTKSYLNKFINENIESYLNLYHKLHGNVKFKSYNVVLKKLSIVDQILLLKKCIYRQSAEKKLEYLQKFIDEFTEKKPNDTNFYNKYNNKPILCTHYQKLINTTNDESEYDYIKYIEEFGEMRDDTYYCKYCHEYLSPDIDQSNIEFDENSNPVYKEELKTDESEVDIEKLDIYKVTEVIMKISSIFGVDFTNSDLIEVIEIYNSLNNNLFLVQRYNNDSNILKNNQYLVNLNKNDKLIYLENTNKIIFITIVVLIYIQTSIPPYTSRRSSNIKLIDLTNDNYKNINVNPDIINNTLIKSLISLYSKKFEMYQMEEFVKDTNPVTPRFQFINSVIYIVSSKFSKILERIQKYQEYTGVVEIKNIRNEWSLFRPLSSNYTVNKINNLLNTEQIKENLIKKVGVYSLENVALFESLKDSSTIIKSDQLQISNIDLLRNQSFLRLYDLILILYGTQRDNIYMNLLIERLINTGGKIETFLKNIFGEYGWDKKFKDGISFKNLRIILLQIIKYCRTDKECIKTLSLFVHKSFNNTRLITLNTRPKRIYNYTLRDVYPLEDYTDLDKDSPIRKIFDIYCYDINGYVIRRPSPIKNLIDPHIDIDISIDLCEQKIIPTNENFRLLIEKLHIQNTLDKIPHKDYTKSSNERLLKYIYDSPNLIKMDPFTDMYDLFINYQNDYQSNTLTKESTENYYKKKDKLVSNLINERKSMINQLSDYLNKTDNITIEHKKLINLKNIDSLLNFTLNSNVSNFYYVYIQNIIRTISRIKNQTNTNRGCYFNPNIHRDGKVKIWNLSEYNREKLENFLKNREFLLHDSVFINKSEDYKGFYEYLQSDIDNKIIKSYKNIFDIINPYIVHLNLLQGINSELFDKQFELNMIKYILILILYKILDFIRDTGDEDETDSGNELFNSLQKKSIEDIKERNITLSNLLLDLIINLVQEHKDSEWVSILSNKDELSKKLSKEREIEKQSILNKKKNKKSIDRYIEDQMNAIGVTNMWRDAKRDNETRVETDEFDLDIIQQRKEADALNGIDTDTLGQNTNDHQGYDIPDDNEDDNEDDLMGLD